MKISPPEQSQGRARGMTLVELTVMVAVLLGMAAVLFVGARAWKLGSDRTGCILNIRNVQMAVRSYQNVYGYLPGSSHEAITRPETTIAGLESSLSLLLPGGILAITAYPGHDG